MATCSPLEYGRCMTLGSCLTWWQWWHEEAGFMEDAQTCDTLALWMAPAGLPFARLDMCRRDIKPGLPGLTPAQFSEPFNPSLVTESPGFGNCTGTNPKDPIVGESTSWRFVLRGIRTPCSETTFGLFLGAAFGFLRLASKRARKTSILRPPFLGWWPKDLKMNGKPLGSCLTQAAVQKPERMHAAVGHAYTSSGPVTLPRRATCLRFIPFHGTPTNH